MRIAVQITAPRDERDIPLLFLWLTVVGYSLDHDHLTAVAVDTRRSIEVFPMECVRFPSRKIQAAAFRYAAAKAIGRLNQLEYVRISA